MTVRQVPARQYNGDEAVFVACAPRVPRAGTATRARAHSRCRPWRSRRSMRAGGRGCWGGAILCYTAYAPQP